MLRIKLNRCNPILISYDWPLILNIMQFSTSWICSNLSGLLHWHWGNHMTDIDQCSNSEGFIIIIHIYKSTGQYNTTATQSMKNLSFLHDWPWISPWIKSISNELDITCHVLASQLSGHRQSIVTSSAECKASEWDTGMMCEDPRF